MRFGSRSFGASAIERGRHIFSSVIELVKASVIGVLIFGSVLAIEYAASYFGWLDLAPNGDATQDIAALPRIAVPLLAAFVGFYLATIGIVLANAYADVSASIRDLILDAPQTRLYRYSLGVSIGAGLAMILVQDTGIFDLGYLTLGAYVLLVCFSCWAFVQLAFGAFDLLNPMTLSFEPLRVLSQTINNLDSRGLLMDDAVLRGAALNANRNLELLEEIIRMAKNRESVDRYQLALMVGALLSIVQNYSRRKHRLAPSIGWFISEIAYPRWFETTESETLIALKTSTPLHPRLEPVPDWLETRTAELAATALEACVSTNDVDAAVKIARSAKSTAGVMASCYRIDEAIAFAEIIRDRCWNKQSDNDAANVVAAEPPLILTDILLAWQRALIAWPEEINSVVDETKWGSSTEAVPIRGSLRVCNFAQRLLSEIHCEIDIEGRRITPKWYLRSALASESVLSLREFAATLPKRISSYSMFQQPDQFTPEVRAAMGSQALQMLQKAESLAETSHKALEGLNTLHRGHDVQPAVEMDAIGQHIDNLRVKVLVNIAEAVAALRPEQSKSTPDYFGEAVYTLMHHAEQAISEGNTDLIQRVFPQTLQATMALGVHMLSTYQPPSYHFGPAVLNPMLDALELSGLALIYDALRGDRTADPVRRAWQSWHQGVARPQNAAKMILDLLELTVGSFHPISNRRFEWQRRLTRRIVDAGYARPEPNPFGQTSEWNAPPLIKMIGVSEHMRNISLDPHTIFAARVLGPMADEPETQLRSRRSLKRYFRQLDLFGGPDDSIVTNPDHAENETETADD